MIFNESRTDDGGLIADNAGSEKREGDNAGSKK